MKKGEHIPWVYRISRMIAWALLKLLFRYEIHEVERVPRKGGCVLASNHASYLDPPLIGSAVPYRRVHFMTRDTLYKNAFITWLFNQYGCVPVDRDRGDASALRKGLSVLKDGGVLALFPEGTRTMDGELQAPKGGIGFLIAKAQVPVIPVYVSGSYEAFPKGAKRIHPTKIDVFYGKPIGPEELAALGKGREAYEQIGEMVMGRIRELREKAPREKHLTK